MSGNLVITNIGRLVTMEPSPGREGPLGVIADAVLLVKTGKIVWFGSCDDGAKVIAPHADFLMIDAAGGVVTPGLVDAHTHLVHGGFRSREFALKMQGVSYVEVAKQGGGIQSTVAATRKEDPETLFRNAADRLAEGRAWGTTTMEIKTGYGLDLETELKSLEVIRQLAEKKNTRIMATFLAHTIPLEYRNRRTEYLHIITEEILPKIVRRNVVKFFDVFIDELAFSKEQAVQMAHKAKELGLQIRLHVDQLSAGGGAELAAQLGAVSAEHLDHISDAGIRALALAQVSAVVLPGVYLFMRNAALPPVRKLLDAKVNLAIATDYNPGTNPNLNLFLMGTIAATKFTMTLDEVWKAMTLHAAKSLGLENVCGSIAMGKSADLLVLDCVDEYFPFYRYGENCVREVIGHGLR